MSSHPIYEFYAELADYQPKIWRRFQVSDNVTVARLGYVLMTLFEMEASHLFRIEVPARENFITKMRDRLSDNEYARLIEKPGLYEVIDETMVFEIITDDTYLYRGEDEKVNDAVTDKIKHVLRHPHEKLSFIYDFGDNWTVNVTLERVFKDDALPGRSLPRVIEGEGYGIIEDCGGVTGLADLAKAFKKKKGSEYNTYRKWLGINDLDISSFDIDDMNFRLSKVPRIYSDIYEHELEPTKQSMDILQRRYMEQKKS